MPRLYQTPSYELWWEPSGGTICLQSPGRVFEGIPAVDLVIRKNVRTVSGRDLISGRISQETLHDEHGLGQIINIHYLETAGIALTLRIRLYQNRPFVLLRISITNVGSESVRIRHFSLRSTPGGVRSTAPPHGFFSNGCQSVSPAAYHNKDVFAVEPGWPLQRGRYLLIDSHKNIKHVSRKGLHISEMVGAVITPKEALVGGAITTANQFVQFYADLHSDNMQVELLSQADDVILDVGAASSSEWFYLEWVPLPNVDPFAQYVHAIIRQMKLGSMRTILPGLRSPEIPGQQYSESVLFDRMASAVLFSDVLPLNNIGVPDVCYSNGDKKWDHEGMRFSHSCNWIAQRIAGSGFMAKITMSPLLLDPHSNIVQAHPDWLLRTYRNTPVTARLPDRTALCLDITIPAVLEYLKGEIDTVVNQWGFSGINLDNMVAAVLPGHRYNQRLTRAQSLRQVYNSIRSTAGQDVYITASRSPFGPAVGLVDAMQTSSASTTSWRPHRRRFHPKWGERPTLPTVRNTLLNTINRAWMNKHLWVNDPGPLMLKEKTAVVSRQELINQITVLGLSGVALSFAEDLAEFTPEFRSLLSLLFPPFLDGFDVVNLF
ncbi:MAG: hypothetical protein E4H27_02385 [Anaerolineales bacterium]|nr:MAG: hypothetical protein E4H27_02385 [Anaerolineales bacterium]